MITENVRMIIYLLINVELSLYINIYINNISTYLIRTKLIKSSYTQSYAHYPQTSVRVIKL